MKAMLNQLYRFGIPVLDGFHYDVQKEHNDSLDGLPLDCIKQGKVLCSGTHVNVYPNDYVRK